MPVPRPPTPCSALLCARTVTSSSRTVPARSLTCPPPRLASTVTPRSTWSPSISSLARSSRICLPLPTTWMSPRLPVRNTSFWTSPMMTTSPSLRMTVTPRMMSRSPRARSVRRSSRCSRRRARKSTSSSRPPWVRSVPLRPRRLPRTKKAIYWDPHMLCQPLRLPLKKTKGFLPPLKIHLQWLNDGSGPLAN